MTTTAKVFWTCVICLAIHVSLSYWYGLSTKELNKKYPFIASTFGLAGNLGTILSAIWWIWS